MLPATRQCTQGQWWARGSSGGSGGGGAIAAAVGDDRLRWWQLQATLSPIPFPQAEEDRHPIGSRLCRVSSDVQAKQPTKRANQQKRAHFTHLLASKAVACVHDWLKAIRPLKLPVAQWLGAMTAHLCTMTAEPMPRRISVHGPVGQCASCTCTCMFATSSPHTCGHAQRSRSHGVHGRICVACPWT